ncbi:hypothetical protein [Neolewinella antarctica]|uniref:Flp pilus assembly protein TadB n=1 Tax=Neolewinella antarctica TaxID=442734 RepID=A0ABX0XDS0_9BACT|nr:hypothetical protein [Neolewinella antarctica]NJC27459.1 Flp pilus assembly protein TadB [Neolewinella antarctica]
MRQIFLLLFTLLLSAPAHAALSIAATPPVASVSAPQMFSSKDFSAQSAATNLGRKLRFTERLGLAVARGKMKRAKRRAAKSGTDKAPADNFALASFGAGILAVLLFAILLPQLSALIVAALLGISASAFGFVALLRFRRNRRLRTGKGFAIAGLVLGGLFTVLMVVFLIAIAVDPNRAG